MVTSDAGNIGTGNVLSATTTVDFTVAPVADTPVNTVSSVNNLPTGTSVVSLAGHLSVHDGDVNDTMFVTVRAGNGVSGIGWGAFTPSQQFTFAGMESFLNPLLNNLVAYVQPGFSGQATVQVTTSDALGNSDTDPIFLNVDCSIATSCNNAWGDGFRGRRSARFGESRLQFHGVRCEQRQPYCYGGRFVRVDRLDC